MASTETRENTCLFTRMVMYFSQQNAFCCMNIFALRGKGESGKSSTIRLLHVLFTQNNYRVVDTSFNPQGGDFRTVFSKNNKLIGITSSGDTFDLVYNNLGFLISSGCTICVCACRTYDRSGHGSNAAIDSFPNFQKQYVDKTVVAVQQPVANQTDAQTLFSLVDAIV
jgi:hypothetical protein